MDKTGDRTGELETQAAVLNWLAQPATHGGCAVKRFDTHISSVFLAGEHAYKVKRAIRFPFLDFTTLDKRKAACEEELRVNKAFAPELYVRVIPVIREHNGSLTLGGGTGNAIEWAVEMRRFDENYTLDRLADLGKIDDRIADALGRAVAAAHQAAAPVEPGPWIQALSSFVEQNDVELRQAPDIFPPGETAALLAATRTLLDHLRPLLFERGRCGLVRRGHGDLHLGNIVMLGDRAVLFDAIEFDPLVAAGDVLYDLAFLLMDLVERNQLRNANTVLNRYLAASGRVADLDALAALPLFLSIRAAIRAKVTLARRRFVESSAQPAIALSARTYFDLACRLVKPKPPILVAVGGLSGTGKSALAKALAPDLEPIPGAVVLRSDVERKTLFKRAETDRLPPEAYSIDVSKQVYANLQMKAKRAIAAGHSVVVDAVFARLEERDSVAALARSHNVRFRGLFLTADLEVRLARVGTRSPDASDANAHIVRQQDSYDLGSLERWAIINAAGLPSETLRQSKAVLNKLPSQAADSAT